MPCSCSSKESSLTFLPNLPRPNPSTVFYQLLTIPSSCVPYPLRSGPILFLQFHVLTILKTKCVHVPAISHPKYSQVGYHNNLDATEVEFIFVFPLAQDGSMLLFIVFNESIISLFLQLLPKPCRLQRMVYSTYLLQRLFECIYAIH